jgi:c-di-GMP-binding flagellar brake protein YcgR
MTTQPAKALKSRSERRQRRYARYRVEFPVALTLFSGTEHQQIGAHCRDLSEAGIGVLIAAEVPMGEVAALSFTLPGLAEAWDVRAVLRHRRGYHYGFEFLSLSDQQNQVLLKYLPGLQRADRDSGASLRNPESSR